MASSGNRKTKASGGSGPVKERVGAHRSWLRAHRPRPLCRVPDGGGRDPAKPVRRHPAHDRGTAVAADHIDFVVRSVVACRVKNDGKGASRWQRLR